MFGWFKTELGSCGIGNVLVEMGFGVLGSLSFDFVRNLGIFFFHDDVGFVKISVL